MASQTIARRLAVLEAATYEPVTKAAFKRFGARAVEVWSRDELHAFDAALRASNELTPEVMAWIESDAELFTLWREICRIGWLQFYSETGSITSEHAYYS